MENDKLGHVTPGKTVLVVQMSPDWSAERFHVPPEEFVPEVVEKAGLLLGTPLSAEWWDSQRWKFAHPFSRADRAELRVGEADGLFFAGDALVGKGRVHLAIESGLKAGMRIRNSLCLK